jgi:CBS domain-containing protein
MICPRCGFDNLPGSDECERCLLDLAPLDRPEGQDRVERSLLEDCVGDLLANTPVTVPPDATLGRAVQTMLETGVGAVLVVDGGGRLVGIFSERDLLKKVAGLHEPFESLSVADFMTRDPETVSADDTLAFVLARMDVGGYRHLPVVRDGKPVSVVSVRDMLRHITELCREL